MGRTPKLSLEQVKHEILKQLGTTGQWPTYNELRHLKISGDRLYKIYSELKQEYQSYDLRHIQALELLTGLPLKQLLTDLETTRPSKLSTKKLNAFIKIHAPQLATDKLNNQELRNIVKNAKNPTT